MSRYRKAALTGATWQRCQPHMAQNANHRMSSVVVRKLVGAALRHIWNEAEMEATVDNFAG